MKFDLSLAVIAYDIYVALLARGYLVITRIIKMTRPSFEVEADEEVDAA